MPLKFIDLFAGCGGLSLGLGMAGFEHVLAVEKSEMAAETYHHNFIGKLTSKDRWEKFLSLSTLEQARAGLVVAPLFEVLLNDVLMAEIVAKGVDLVAGGPPCQGFSLAGKRREIDARNNLPWQFLEFVRRVNPRLVLVENVAGMNTRNRESEGARTPFEELAHAISESGYLVQKLQLNAKHYGVPQHRPRVFLMGVRRDIAPHNTFSGDLWSSASSEPCPVPGLEPFPDQVTVQQALADIGEDHYLANNDFEDPRRYISSMRNAYAGERPMNHNLRSHGERTRERFSLYHELSGIAPGLDRLLGFPAQEFQQAKKSLYLSREDWGRLWDLNEKDEASNRWDHEHSEGMNEAWNREQPGFKEAALRAKNKWLQQEKVKFFRKKWEKEHGKLWVLEFEECIELMKREGRGSASSRYGLRQVVERVFGAVFSELDGKAPEMARARKIDLAWKVIELTTLKHSQRPLLPNIPSPTILSIPDDFVHPWKPRTLTVRELARLQSFPDDFEFRAKETTGGKNRRRETPQYTQVGNAVPPFLAMAIGRSLFRLLEPD